MIHSYYQGEDLLRTEYIDNKRIIDNLFELNESIRTIYNSVKDQVSFIISNLIFAKTTKYLNGVFILIKENLGHESGALLRPAIEGIELLEYLRRVPEGIQQAIDDNLPSAGNIAKMIDGKFQTLRKYLNQDSSHFHMSFNSMINLFDAKNVDVLYDNGINKNVFTTNLKMVSLFLLYLNYQGILIDKENTIISRSMKESYNDIRRKLFNIYGIDDEDMKTTENID
jgi:hypothetical protein